MEPDFWHQKWATNDIGFHQQDFHLFLTQYFSRLKLKQNARVFVPLCGKTKDMHWLVQQGMRVVGVELSPVAVKQFFIEWGKQPVVTQHGELTLYQTKNIEIFVGNIFDLSLENLGHIDAVFDRAALVALPPVLRQQYAQHLKLLCAQAPQLLISFDYDQLQLNGPPFSVPEQDIGALYQDTYSITQLDSIKLTGGLKGKVAATENLYLLTA